MSLVMHKVKPGFKMQYREINNIKFTSETFTQLCGWFYTWVINNMKKESKEKKVPALPKQIHVCMLSLNNATQSTTH